MRMVRLHETLRVGLLIGGLAFQCPGLTAQVDPCTLLPDPGPCEAAIPAWYFDNDWGSCTQFTWGGCGGTVPFETLEECLAQGCPQEGTLAGLCDSIGVTIVSVGDAQAGRMDIEVAPDYVTPYWFGYCGFALFDAEGNLLASEDVNTAPNAYGFDGFVEPHVRHLEYQPGVDLSTWAAPFEVELRLYEGWMAGEVTQRCHWTWTAFETVVGIAPLTPSAEPVEWASFDLLGRPCEGVPGALVIQRSPDGRVRKVISE